MSRPRLPAGDGGAIAATLRRKSSTPASEDLLVMSPFFLAIHSHARGRPEPSRLNLIEIA